MRAMNEEEANLHLSPYLQRLCSAVATSVNGYYTGTEYAKTRHKHSPRSAASICHDEIKAAIIREFEGLPGVSFKNQRGLFLVRINGTIVLRFKKFNRKNLSSGIETHQLVAFNHQEAEQLELQEMPPNGLLHVGYRVNKLQTGIEGVYISCRQGNNNLWVWDISAEGKKIVERVLIPQPETNVPSRRKITAKGKSFGGGEVNANE